MQCQFLSETESAAVKVGQSEPEQTERSDGTLSKARVQNYNSIGQASEEEPVYIFHLLRLFSNLS